MGWQVGFVRGESLSYPMSLPLDATVPLEGIEGRPGEHLNDTVPGKAGRTGVPETSSLPGTPGPPPERGGTPHV